MPAGIRNEQVDLVAEQGADAAELELLLHVDVHVGPARQVRRHHLQQPLVARVALHADAQAAALALRELVDALLRQRELRQHAVGHRQQVLAGLGRSQAAALAQPDLRAELLLELAHGVAERRLRQAQHVGRGSQRALLVDLLDDAEMDSFKHEGISWIGEK